MRLVVSFIKDERGSALILTAIALVILIGFGALAVDGGRLYHRHTRLQDIADACALAAGGGMAEATGSDTDKKNKAMSEAEEYAAKNGITINSSSGYTANVTYADGETGTMQLTFPNGVKEAKVAFAIDTKLFLARVLGLNSTIVSSKAKARIGTAKTCGEDLVPVMLIWDKEKKDSDDTNDDYEIGDTITLTENPGDGTRGNYGYLDFKKEEGASKDKGGGSEFEQDLEDGFDGLISIGQDIDTNPGVTAGQVDTGMNGSDGRITEGRTIITVPIIDATQFSSTKGKSVEVTVLGFARLEIVSYDKKTKYLVAKFVDTVAFGPISDTETEDFFNKSVALVE